MVVSIYVSDERGEHFELKTDGTIRLFGTKEDVDNNAVILSERQATFLAAAIMAKAQILAVKR